jgi:chitosanase
MITPELIRIFCRILNAFENDSGSPETDYKSVYIYNDGNNKRKQVTLARGFTDDGGSLKKVIERYIAKGGALTKLFSARLDKFGKGVLHTDREFIGALHTAASEKAMQEAQDEIFNEVYLNPALEWASTYKFEQPLSVGVIVDSFLHSGTMTKFLMARFPEHKPASGGNEKVWIRSYLTERLAWFERVSGPLHNTRYRPRFFLGEIDKGNWPFACPLVANGSRVC